jgi:hypothetical protein
MKKKSRANALLDVLVPVISAQLIRYSGGSGFTRLQACPPKTWTAWQGPFIAGRFQPPRALSMLGWYDTWYSGTLSPLSLVLMGQ